MQTLLALLWTDQIGSTFSAEMALVTFITVGALLMGMSDFSATANRELPNSAHDAGLAGPEEATQEKDAGVRNKQTEAEKTDEEKAKDEKTRNQWRSRRAEDRKTPENRG